MHMEKQDLYALTPVDRYNSGFSHGKQQALSDFQSNSPFNPVCSQHTNYYCAGHFKGYNVTWNNLSTKGQTPNPSSASNSTNPVPPVGNSNAMPLLLLFHHQTVWLRHSLYLSSSSLLSLQQHAN